MGDATDYRQPPQASQNHVLRASHMQDDRQLVFASQPQLRIEELQLTSSIEPRHEMVEPDLANPDKLRVTDRRIQCVPQALKIFECSPLDIKWMDSQGIRRPRDPAGKTGNALKVTDFHRWNNQSTDAGTLRAGDHGVAIGVKLGRIKVAMGIDQHNGLVCTGTAPLP
jgi:hypothetical protein